MVLSIVKWVVIAIVAIAVLLLVFGQLGLLSGSAPKNLGLREGKLKPPSKTPNSVSSQADLWPEHEQQAYARITPLALRGDGAATIAKLKALIEAMGGAKVVESQPGYLHVQFSTKLMKFTDDAEFWFDPAAQVIHVRSASRVGRRDFGVNRQRIEAIRARLAAQ
jgi:uncharacterized protein (DUF1499 family)